MPQIDNLMLKPTPRYDFNLVYSIVGKRCGCGQTAEYLVYEHAEKHCQQCMLEAVDCGEFVPVRRM